MLKKIVKILLVVFIAISIGVAYLYFRLNNSIENVLIANNEWRSEVLEFPLLFAGDLEYEGEEHIRFAPGWGEKNSEDYFSYVFLWILQNDPNLNASALENAMNSYFDGLMNTGAITNFNFLKKIPKTKSLLEQTHNNTFKGSIEVYDEFFSNKVIILNAKIKMEPCPLKKQHLVWFYLSPQKNQHPIWNQLENVKANLTCH